MKNAYKILIRKPEEKRLLGTFSRRWEDNIRMDLRKPGLGGVEPSDWILMNTVMKLLVGQAAGDFMTRRNSATLNIPVVVFWVVTPCSVAKFSPPPHKGSLVWQEVQGQQRRVR
jgi:hypothetical protein